MVSEKGEVKFNQKPADSEPEEKPIRKTAWEEGVEEERKKLKAALLEVVESARKKGAPVNEYGRIDMNSYSEIQGYDVEDDEKYVANRRQQWKGGISQEAFEEQKLRETGGKFEALKTAICSKFLGKDFIVVRSSAYDDIHKGIDNVILKVVTNEVVCAFDEVGEISGDEFKHKMEEVLAKNKNEGGGKLKYGLGFDENSKGKKELVLKKVFNIPIMCLALSPDMIKKGIGGYTSLYEKKSEPEKELFIMFVKFLNFQIGKIEADREINKGLKDKLSNFREVLRKVAEKSGITSIA